VKLADVSVRRPVFAVMMTAALIVMGWFSYRQLGLDLMPKTDYPVVSVMTSLSGASAEEVETSLTKPVEEAVNSIAGVDELSASSSQGSSRVSITFVLEREIESATQDVRDKVAGIMRSFPRDTLPPTVNKMDPDSSPILTIIVSGQRSSKEITEIADKKIKQVLETIEGVGGVSFQGDRHREIQLLLDADRLNAYNLTVDQVRNAVQRQNVEIPGGSFTAGASDIAMRTMGRLSDVEDFNKILISYRDGMAIRFGDIGRVTDGVEEVRGATRLDGRAAISVMIRKQTGTNTVDIIDRVFARLKRIELTLPSDIRMQPIRDQSRFIRKSFEEIRLHLLFGGLLASIVVFLFMRNWRLTIIAALAIPTSIIGTFTVMKALGFTLNNMTMLALSLATGIVIDDAIVVLENIFRYIEEKKVSPKEAAMKATAEIGLAVMATTLSLVVIFLPVAFMTGQVGRYFYSFGITSAAAMLISMFVSFTLTPALCSWWLRSVDERAGGHRETKSRGAYAWVDRSYGRMLDWSLHHRGWMLGIAGAVVASVVVLFPYVGKELVPDDDQSEFSINVRLPQGTSYARTEEYVKNIEAELRDPKKLPEVAMVLTSVSSGSANFYIGLTPLESRSLSQQELMRRARVLMRKYPGARIGVSGGTDLSGASSGGGRGGGGGGSNRLNILIQGPDIEQLQIYTTKLMTLVRTIAGVVDVDSNFEPTQPELRIITDRARAADLGVSIDSLASSMRSLVGGEEVGKFKDGDDQYSVRLRLDQRFRENPAGLSEMLIPAANGKTVRVADVAQLVMDRGPATIQRYNRQRQISVNANLDKVPLGEVVANARAKVVELNMKPGYQAVFGGSARTLDEASNDFLIAILLAVAFIYMVLASQFNSFIHPLTIMTALPLSLPAGILSLMAFGMTINVYSAIGLMMLFGIVKKNSILQVDYTNTLRAEGMERHQALMTANHVRLRPILMTTMSIVAGMLPIAFGKGAGSGSRASMAVTIIGGQILCLLLTLLVTPVVYSYFDDMRELKATDILKAIANRIAGRKAVKAALPGARPTPATPSE
jgi:HAE1 family hydrophobic/amphiphilic exporter-1